MIWTVCVLTRTKMRREQLIHSTVRELLADWFILTLVVSWFPFQEERSIKLPHPVKFFVK